MNTQLSKGILMVKDNIIPNHMDIYWHDYTGHVKDKPITEASVPVKAALIGRVGLMLLSCGTGAWRVRSSMNAISEQLGVTCTSSIGLMTIVYTCFDGHKTFTNSLCLNNTGVNTSKLDRLERFVKKFPTEGVHKSGEQLHQELDEIEKIRGSIHLQNSVLQLRLPVQPSLFSLAADRSKCCALLSAREQAISSVPN